MSSDHRKEDPVSKKGVRDVLTHGGFSEPAKLTVHTCSESEFLFSYQTDTVPVSCINS